MKKNKNPLDIFIYVAIGAAIIAYATMAASIYSISHRIEQHGLKSIVEQIWHGKPEMPKKIQE